MSPNFDKAFNRLFGHEGGWTNDPRDRGNWTTGVIGKGECNGTKFGISAASYPNLDIKSMTMTDAMTIYYNDFWKKLQLDQYPAALTFQVFDAAVNHGIPRAIKLVQNAIKTTADGVVGPKTLAALSAIDVNDLILLFLANRLSFMVTCDGWSAYGGGWSNRIAHNLQYASEDN